MTTKIIVLNEGPADICMTPGQPNGALNKLAAQMILPGRFSSGLYVHAGQSFRLDEVLPGGTPASEFADPDIIEYGTVRGEQRTIHASEQLDVEVDYNGRVVAVWFRCARLPFKQVQVDEPRASDMRFQKEQVNKYGLMAVTLRRKT